MEKREKQEWSRGTGENGTRARLDGPLRFIETRRGEKMDGLDLSERVHDPKTFNRSSAAASSADRDQLLQFVLSQTPVPRSDLFVAATDVGE